jgi:hypothetical protein
MRGRVEHLDRTCVGADVQTVRDLRREISCPKEQHRPSAAHVRAAPGVSVSVAATRWSGPRRVSALERGIHLVIRSIPGHGFSGRPATTGWDRTHRAFLGGAGEAPRRRTVRRVERRLGLGGRRLPDRWARRPVCA